MNCISPKFKTYKKTTIEKRPFINSYIMKFNQGSLNVCPVDFCEKLIGELSEFFDVDGIIVGHIKGILLTDTQKVSYSVTHTGMVSITHYECDIKSTKNHFSIDVIFRFDILSYVYPKMGFDEFIQSYAELLCK